MAKFLMTPLVDSSASFTTRLGAGSGSANYVTDVEIGKAVKLVAESRYGLCAAGDPIEGFITAVESYTADDFSIGSVNSQGRVTAMADGLEATAGTGTLAVGDYVVAGTAVAKGTALTVGPKVCKATNQPGAVVTTTDNTKANIDIALAAVIDAEANARFAWRVVSLGSGAGAVGTAVVIERVQVNA